MYFLIKSMFMKNTEFEAPLMQKKLKTGSRSISGCNYLTVKTNNHYGQSKNWI